VGCLGWFCHIVNRYINLSPTFHYISANRNSPFWFQIFLVIFILVQSLGFHGISWHRLQSVWRWFDIVHVNNSVVVISEQRWLILSSIRKCERWIDQFDTSLGQRKNLNPLQESNPWPPEHRTRLNEPCSSWVLVAQWIEHPPGVREVMGSFFFVPLSCHIVQFTLHNSVVLFFDLRCILSFIKRSYSPCNFMMSF